MLQSKGSKESMCKHPHLDKKLCCKACGVKVDIREKRNKYHAKRTDGFHSAKEARRFATLKSMGVWPIECQVKFDLTVNGVHICEYWADFRYEAPYSAGLMLVEDAKPRGKNFRKTEAYRLFIVKKRLMQACHGIEVIEV